MTQTRWALATLLLAACCLAGCKQSGQGGPCSSSFGCKSHLQCIEKVCTDPQLYLKRQAGTDKPQTYREDRGDPASSEEAALRRGLSKERDRYIKARDKEGKRRIQERLKKNR